MWNPKQTGKEMGIEFLNQGGFLESRFDIIELMDDRSFMTQDKNYAQAVLPWLETSKSSDHFERNDALLDAIDLYTDLCQHMRKQTLIKLSELNDNVISENLRRRLLDPDAENIPLFLESDLEGYVVEPELEELRGKLEQKLLWMGKTLLGISFKSPDDNKTLVLDKQVIFEQNPQTRAIFDMLKEAIGSDKYGSEKYGLDQT
jgi:hypothetical protein